MQRPFYCAVLSMLAMSLVAAEPSPKVLQEIRDEATRSNGSDIGRPLPLAAHWNNAGAKREGFSPEYQLQLLEQGRHILPWMEWPPTAESLDHNFKPDDPRRQKYIDDRLKEFEPVVKRLAAASSCRSRSWQPSGKARSRMMRRSLICRRIRIRTSWMRTASPNGKFAPFGPIEPWREVGRRWTDNFFMKQMQEWYPDPPLVLLISNNEHAKLQWNEVEASPRYLDKYGPDRSDDFKRKAVGDGWIERYDAMIKSLKGGLTSEAWRQHAKCVGYEAFPPVHFGRWAGWKQYSLYSPGRIDPFPLCWDGGSPSYYLHNWMAITDYTLWSPQIETMNWVFMLDEVKHSRPEFWFELSTWDGDQPGAGNDKRKFYARQGQPFTPARYEGFVQYGMWLTRPRVVREFRGYLETVEYAGPYFEVILDAVDRVYRNPGARAVLAQRNAGGQPSAASILSKLRSRPSMRVKIAGFCSIPI